MESTIQNITWNQLSRILKRIRAKSGAPGKLSVRMFIEAMLYLIRTGLPWRDLPPEFGNWEAVYMRFRRWEEKGIWCKLWETLKKP